MTVEQARAALEEVGQGPVLRFWERLDAAARQALLAQIGALDFAALRRQQQALRAFRAAGPGVADDLQPAAVTELEGAARAEAVRRGESEWRAGRVGVVLVAGGQGSRLGFDGPKGAFPIGPVSQACLFYFHARKILAISRRFGARPPLYIMTSDGNDAATRACFASQGCFGLDAADIRFFVQGTWPALDAQGNILLDEPGHIFMSPDGHGGTLSALARSGALADMERRGLTTLFYFQVDNPLVDIADPAFVGLHLLRGAEMSLKVCAKRDPQEGLGVVVRHGDRCAMVEYTELTDEQKQARNADGALRFKYGSVAIHLFALSFLRREAARDLPLHVAHKKIPCLDEAGRRVQPAAPNGFKFEKFIFDVLPDAQGLVNLAFDRREEFAPVKNAAGADSPASCQAALTAKWARWLAAAGIDLPVNAEGVPPWPIEIDPLFADSAAALAARRPLAVDRSRAIWLHE